MKSAAADEQSAGYEKEKIPECLRARHNPMTTKQALKKAFLSDVITDPCWLWTGSRDAGGYGRISFRGRSRYTHRVSYCIHHECPHLEGLVSLPCVIPPGMMVCHRCDNRACVNPNHLFLGTARDNVRDRDRKNRANSPEGERNGLHKLTAAQVEAIRSAKRTKKKELAKAFGVSRSTIYAIRAGKIWKHLPSGTGASATI